MKTNELFISELKKYLSTLEFVDTPEANNKIYGVLCNYYMPRKVSVDSDIVKKIIGLQPGYEEYVEINEDVKEILEDYINDFYVDLSDKLCDHYISECDKGNFEEDCDLTPDEWNEMTDEEKGEYWIDLFCADPFGYTDMASFILNEVADIFEEAYAKEITKKLKTAIKNNIEVECEENVFSEYGVPVARIKKPLKIALKDAEMTKKELIEILTEEETMQDIMTDLSEDDEITEEDIAIVIGNIISNNTWPCD